MRHEEKDRERERDACRRWYDREAYYIKGEECASTRTMKRVVGVRHGR